MQKLEQSRRLKVFWGLLTLLWVPLVFGEQAGNSSHYGGTLRLLAVASDGTLDPHINYSSLNWPLYAYTHDGLVTFKKAGGVESVQVVPDLAQRLPDISADGLTYRFTLRQGIQFSNGKTLDVNDVLASFQRIFKVFGPTSGSFYNGIVGADKCLAEPATCSLEGGVVVDAKSHSVTIHLTQPDAEFLYKLSVPHAVIVPADTPTQDMGNQPIAGTGTYQFEQYDPNARLTLVRNPYFQEWSKEAQPKGYPDRIEYRFGGTEESAVNAILNGQADGMYEPVPVGRLTELSVNQPNQLHVSSMNAWWYAPLNVNLPPFNDVRVRKALNYAVDRDALVALFGGAALAEPVCTILPPDMPGHAPHCDYTQNPGEYWSAPDMDKARELVKASGTAGQKVTVVSEDSVTSRAVGAYLQSVLTDLGYDTALQSISGDIQFTYIQNSNNRVQISVTQWYQDYPAPSNFLYVLFGCDSFTPGSDSSVNMSGFCDKSLDNRMKAAMRLAVTDEAAAHQEWGRIDRDMMALAPVVPLFTPKHIDLISTRVGNYQFSSRYRWLLGNAWVQ